MLKGEGNVSIHANLRAALHYGGEVHRSWFLGDLWNLMGREWLLSVGGLH